MTHHHQHHAGAETDETAMAALLDLDAEVLHAYLSDVTAWLDELVDDPPRRILDLGAGTGAGTVALAQRFTTADVTAMDISAHLLGRLNDKAHRLGIANRVNILQTDLDTTLPAIDPVDLVWAANSLHHMADPDRVLAEVFAALRPGGYLVVAEMEGFPRFLPADLGHGLGSPGLEARCHAALAEHNAAGLPHLGADWGAFLTSAGFTIQAERHFTIELAPPLPALAGQYAQATLRRIRDRLDDRLGADDLATLDTLLDSHGPQSLLRRDDLTISAARTIWVARRP